MLSASIKQTHQQYFYCEMASYAQTTIHSKVAKFQKISGDGSLGRVVKGTLTPFARLNKSMSKPEQTSQIMKQIEILPKTRTNVARKMRNKVIPSVNKKDEIILMQSSVFPAIYFKKTTMRNVLKEFNFPDNVKALPPNDDRMALIFQIVSNLFNEINFYIFNILIGENIVTQSFYVFFSDSQTIPFTKCCNAPVYIELMDNGSGKILCNSLKCPHSNLAEFLINFQDGKKLWKNITYFADASEKDRELRQKISRFINNGKHKRISLVNIVQDTSKEIVDLFYHSKHKKEMNEDYSIAEDVDNQFHQTPFLTAGNPEQSMTIGKLSQTHDQPEISVEDIISPEQKNIELLKMKIQFMTKTAGQNLSKDLTKDLVNNGKVFHKNFEMIRKIDEFMLGQKRSKNTTRVSFPKIMDQMKKEKTRSQKSNSVYRSFT